MIIASVIRFGAANLAHDTMPDERARVPPRNSRWNSNGLRVIQDGEARLKECVADNAIFNERVTSI
jgi:hypothetical protein